MLICHIFMLEAFGLDLDKSPFRIFSYFFWKSAFVYRLHSMFRHSCFWMIIRTLGYVCSCACLAKALA